MKQHNVKLAKGHRLIDAISQCVDFIEGAYGFRPSYLLHNNIDLVRDVAFSSLNYSILKSASVQKIYGMSVTRSTKVKSDSVVLVLVDRSNGERVEVVTITV